MRFGASDQDAVLAALHDPQIQIRVFLFAGRAGAVTLDICHARIRRQVIFLNIFEEVDKALKIIGTMPAVDIVGDDGQRTQTVKAGAPLKAGSDPVP